MTYICSNMKKYAGKKKEKEGSPFSVNTDILAEIRLQEIQYSSFIDLTQPGLCRCELSVPFYCSLTLGYWNMKTFTEKSSVH